MTRFAPNLLPAGPRLWCAVRRMAVIFLVLFYNAAGAHLFLSPEILSDSISPISRITERIAEQPEGSENADAWFELGTHAISLTRLLNDEVRAHGDDQAELLESAVKQAADLGVKLSWAATHKRFFYDGAAFEQYLLLAPQGSHAEFSRFQRIERQFYLASTNDRAELEARVAEKREFLADYPKAGTRLRVAMFLGVDYRDLWRLCLAAGEPECADRYLSLAKQQFSAVANAPSAGETAAVAKRMLQRTSAEAEGYSDSDSDSD